MIKPSKPITRILLVRLSALGDCVAAIPVFLALRKHFPHAHIAWAVQDNTASLLQNMPGLDELIIFPRRRWKTLSSKFELIKEALNFARRLRRKRFDLTIDVQSNSKSSFIAYCTGAKHRIGHGKGESKEISGWLNNHLVDVEQQTKHVILRNLHLLSALGIKTNTPEFTFSQNHWFRRKVQGMLAVNGIQTPFALMVPFTSKIEKEWKPESYKSLTMELANRGIPVVFLHSPGKTNETQDMIPQTCSSPVCLAPLMTIPEMVELIRLSALVAGGDTGPTHIAGAMNKRTFSFFGPTNPERLKPWGETTVYPIQTDPSTVAADMIKFWYKETWNCPH